MLSSVYTWEGCKISTSLGMGSIGNREKERHGSHDPGFQRMALFSFVLLDFFSFVWGFVVIFVYLFLFLAHGLTLEPGQPHSCW